MKKIQWAALALCLLLAGCGAKHPEQPEVIWTLVQERAVVFSDGMYANRWRTDWDNADIYKLPDGTELLTIQEPIGPDRVYVAGIESFYDLNEAAQAAILAYYEDQGLLYDAANEVKRVYEEYLACESSGTPFLWTLVHQSVSPTAANSRIVCFLTSVTLPLGGGVVEDRRYGAVFDKETGEKLEVGDLFTLPEETLPRQLLLRTHVGDGDLLAEMERAFDFSRLVLFPDVLEISFPEGTLPSQTHGYLSGIEYKDLQGLICDWAVPTPYNN